MSISQILNPINQITVDDKETVLMGKEIKSNYVINIVEVDTKKVNKIESLGIEILNKHLYLVEQEIDNPVMTEDHYLTKSMDCAVRLVEQLYRFLPTYLLLKELDVLFNKIFKIEIEGITFDDEQVFQINYKNKIPLKENTTSIENLNNCCNCITQMNQSIKEKFPSKVYQQIIKMFTNYEVSKKTYKFPIPKNEIMRRYSEVEELYKHENHRLFDYIFEFNKSMSQYLIVSNNNKLKNDFMQNMRI